MKKKDLHKVVARVQLIRPDVVNSNGDLIPSNIRIRAIEKFNKKDKGKTCVLDTKTGEVLMTDKQLIKMFDKWFKETPQEEKDRMLDGIIMKETKNSVSVSVACKKLSKNKKVIKKLAEDFARNRIS